MTDNAPLTLALFPLPIVDVPGEIVPLHIFEPRYRQLVADRTDDSQSFGMTNGTDDDHESVGCAVHIQNVVHQFPDGRLNIIVRGWRRFRVVDIVESDDPYIIARCEWFDDDPGEPIPPDLVEELRTTFRHTAHVKDWGINLPVDIETDAAKLSWLVADAMNLSGDAKQALLEMNTVEERMRTAIRWLGAALLGGEE